MTHQTDEFLLDESRDFGLRLLNGELRGCLDREIELPLPFLRLHLLVLLRLKVRPPHRDARLRELAYLGQRLLQAETGSFIISNQCIASRPDIRLPVQMKDGRVYTKSLVANIISLDNLYCNENVK